MNFLSSSKFLAVLIFLSVALIGFGMWLVKYNESKYAEQTTDVLSSTAASDSASLEIEKLEKIASDAQLLLQETSQNLQGPAALELSKEHQAELIEKYKDAIPAVGTDAWCDYMMVKPNAEWTDEDKGQFAKNCI